MGKLLNANLNKITIFQFAAFSSWVRLTCKCCAYGLISLGKLHRLAGDVSSLKIIFFFYLMSKLQDICHRFVGAAAEGENEGGDDAGAGQNSSNFL